MAVTYEIPGSEQPLPVIGSTASVVPKNPRRFTALLLGGLALGTAISGLVRNRLQLDAPGIGAMLESPLAQLQSLLLNSTHWAFRIAFSYTLAVVLFKAFRIHERYGIFRMPEPESHYWTAMRNWRNAFIWGLGTALLWFLLQLDNRSMEFSGHPTLLFRLPEAYVFLRSPSLLTDILYAIIGLYLIDLTDWAAHRFNHSSPFLYNKFPFAHFVHHNHIFINPFTIVASPFIHFTAVTSSIVYALMLSQGLYEAVFMVHIAKLFANMISHLGCDPLPWLSRLNYRVGGWIPWIPLHHQYHHTPSVKGNYGNLTSLWDHVFGTLAPEYIEHVTTGVPNPRIVRIFNNTNGAIDRLMRGKTRMNLR